MKKLSVIIPVFNEKNTLLQLLKKVEDVDLPGIEKEILIIDDKSNDGTREILKTIEDRYKVIYRDKNRGKGSAVRKGFLESSGDYIIIQDADLEYNPEEYDQVLSPIINNEADVVYGSRFLTNKPHRVLYYWHSIGNKLLTTFSNMLTNLTFTDMETCYKAFNRKALDLIKNNLTANRFGIEPEITAQIAKQKDLRIYEVGISYFGRTYDDGKKINWKDGVAAFYYIIKFNLWS